MADPRTDAQTQDLAQRVLVYLICGVTAALVAVCYIGLPTVSGFGGASLIIGAVINAVFRYGVHVGRRGTGHE